MNGNFDTNILGHGQMNESFDVVVCLMIHEEVRQMFLGLVVMLMNLRYYVQK